MDISRLIPYIVKAAMTVTPEEVAAQMQKQEQAKLEDKQRDTVDNDVIEQDERASDDEQNDAEGDLMADSFKELEVEEAIEQAKEEKLLSGNPDIGLGSVKVASYWDLLKARV